MEVAAVQNNISPSIADVFNDPQRFIEQFLKIRSDKSGLGADTIIPFKLNPVQKRVLRVKAETVAAGKERKWIVLKSRRVGITTLEQALSFHSCATNFGHHCMTLAHTAEISEEIFSAVNLFYDAMPKDCRPYKKYSSKKDLDFPYLKSRFFVGTAGNKATGRGTTLQRLHGCEVAQWGLKQDFDVGNLIAGLLEAARYGDSTFESTPRGMGGWFYQTWADAKAGKNNFTPIFIPWFEDELNYKAFKDEKEKAAFIESMSKKEIEVQKKHSLSYEKMYWRRLKIRDLKELFYQEYPEDDVSCFISSGLTFFDSEILQELIILCLDPIETKEGGAVKIWKKPEAGKRYVAGADVGEGVVGGDYSCGGLLDYETGEQVATIHGIWRPEMFAGKLAALGQEYNTALLAVEANNHGHSCLNTLQNTLCYPALYHHIDYDEQTRKKIYKLGWQTNAKTRPIMLDELKAAIENRWMHINDKDFISECFTFVDDTRTGKYEARSGFHDDRVMAWGIAWQARKTPMASLTAL